MTPHWSVSFRTATSQLTDRRLKSWLSGAVLTTWSSTRSKQWRWSWIPGAAETILLCHHWISPLHINNCLVRLSNQIWPQKTTEGGPDCWANHWYNPPHSPRTVLIQSEQKGWKHHSGPSHPAHSLFKRLLSGRRYRAPERPDTEPVSFLRQSISWTLDIKRGTHNSINT